MKHKITIDGTHFSTIDELSEDRYEVGTFNDANHNLDKFHIALEIAKRI